MVRNPFQDTFGEITSVIIVLENRKGLLFLASICFNEFPIFPALSAYQRFFNAQQVNYWKVSLIIYAFVKHCSPLYCSHISSFAHWFPLCISRLRKIERRLGYYPILNNFLRIGRDFWLST